MYYGSLLLNLTNLFLTMPIKLSLHVRNAMTPFSKLVFWRVTLSLFSLLPFFSKLVNNQKSMEYVSSFKSSLWGQPYFRLHGEISTVKYFYPQKHSQNLKSIKSIKDYDSAWIFHLIFPSLTIMSLWILWDDENILNKILVYWSLKNEYKLYLSHPITQHWIID